MAEAHAGDATCPQCGHDTPQLDYCCWCGHPLGATTPPGHRAQYAASPDEPAWAPRLASTLFPQLPRRDMVAFRVAVASGLGLILLLGVAGLIPIALTAAALLLPLLMVLYLYDVDVYEDQPLRVVGLTMALGAAFGVGLGLLLHTLPSPVIPPGLAQYGDRDVLVRVLAIPLADLALALVGPLVLLRYRRFNDVLDGATFGAAAAVALVSAQMLVGAWPLLEEGFRPGQDVGPWSVRLVEVAVLVPVVAAGSVGWVAAALWLRYRAHIADRAKLGLAGQPIAAFVLASVLMVAAAACQRLQNRVGAAFALVVLAGLSLVLLRRAIHLGLLQEATEGTPGPDVQCANCGRTTPLQTFCARCGVSLRALPKTIGTVSR